MSRDAAALAQELHVLYARLAAVAASAADDLSLTTTQRMALFELTGEPLRLGELAARVAVSDPTASRAVEGLVTAGLAVRVPDPDDRRAVRIGATAGRPGLHRGAHGRGAGRAGDGPGAARRRRGRDAGAPAGPARRRPDAGRRRPRGRRRAAADAAVGRQVTSTGVPAGSVRASSATAASGRVMQPLVPPCVRPPWMATRPGPPAKRS